MKKKLLERLKALLEKGADKLSDEESTELKSLQDQAKSANIDTAKLDEAIKAAPDEEEDEEEEDDAKAMTAEDVAEVVKKATAEALAEAKEGEKGLDTEKLAELLGAKLVASTKQAGNKSLKLDTKAVNQIIADTLKQELRSASKMQHPEDPNKKGKQDDMQREFPIEHRAGNMSVAQKQLLNICLSKMPDGWEGKRPAHMNDGISDSLLAQAKTKGINLLNRIQRQGIKALDTSTSGSGAELNYTDLSADLQTRLYLASDLAAALVRREIDMPTDPYKLPIKTVRTAFSLGSEAPSTDYTNYLAGGSPTTADITLDAAKIIGIARYSYEADEDSVVAMLPMLQQDLGEGAAASFESAVINGDNDGTHQDTGGSYTATSVESAFAGIRKAGIAVGVVDWSSGGVSKANFMGLRADMKKYGTNQRDLAIIVDSAGYVHLQAIEEAFRADARGAANTASVNTGMLPSFNGIPVIVSEAVPAGVTAAGIVASSGNSYGTLIITNLSQWVVGRRRQFTVEVQPDIRIQQNYVVASFRRAFVPKETASSSIPHTVIGTQWTP
jgi:HK97 family phage major capsid protein